MLMQCQNIFTEDKTMTEQTNKKYTLLTILVAGLLVAFVAQSLALYGMQKRLTQMTATQPASPPVASAPATPASASLTPVTGPATPPTSASRR